MKHRKQNLLRYNSPPIHIFGTKHKILKQINNMRTLFFFLVLATTLTLNAQITKGNWMVGGDASFNSATVHDSDGNETGKSNGVRIYPNIGHFVADKFAVGLIPSFSYGKTKNGPSNISFGIGPFARYYFLKKDNRINILADANYIYYYSETDGAFPRHNSSFTAKSGVVLFFNNSVALEFTLGYNIDNFSTVTNRINLGFGFQIHLEK